MRMRISERNYLRALTALSFATEKVVVPVRRLITNESEIAAQRQVTRSVLPKASNIPGVTITSRTIQSKNTNVLVYHFLPDSLANRKKLPTMFFYHGGAFAFFSVYHEYRKLISNLAKLLQVQIFSPEYRLAPEHPHPAQFNDSYDSTINLLDHATENKIDLDNFSLCGDSAGGQLVISISYMLSELKSYRPKLVAPIYPAVQLVHGSKHYPCHSGEKRLLTTTSTSRACLHWAGYDGFNQELRQCVKDGYHVSEKIKSDREIMSAVDAELWLPQKYAEVMPKSSRRSGGGVNRPLNCVSALNSSNRSSTKSKSSTNSPESKNNKNNNTFRMTRSTTSLSIAEQIEEFKIRCDELLYDPTFNVGGISDDKLENMADYGPRKWLMVMAEFDPLRDEGIIFANRAKHFGCDVEWYVADGTPHAFVSLAKSLGGFMSHYNEQANNWIIEMKKMIDEQDDSDQPGKIGDKSITDEVRIDEVIHDELTHDEVIHDGFINDEVRHDDAMDNQQIMVENERVIHS